MILHPKAKGLAREITAGRHQVGEVDMIPDGSVVWTQHSVEATGSTVYLPPAPRERAVQQLLRFALRSPDTWFKAGAAGGCGQVHLLGDLAVKIFFRNHQRGTSDLIGLQANVALHTGLQRVLHPNGWQVGAAEMLAASIPARPDGRAVWVMTQEAGVMPHFEDNAQTLNPHGRWPLSGPERYELYTAAIQSCGLPRLAVEFDDKEPNMLVSVAPPTEPGGTSTIAKFDVMGRPSLFAWQPPAGARAA